MVRALVVAFPVVRLLEVVTSGPTTYPDTDTYRVPGGLLDLSLTSLDGGSMRPWGATVWMALWPSDRAMVLAQAVLSIVAWLTLALTVAAGIQQRAALRRVVVLTLLVLALTAQVASWDLAIICESVSISSGILALAAGIRFVRAPAWGRAVVLLLLALWFTMTRPNVFPVLLSWAVAFALLGLARRELRLWGAVAALLVAFSLYSYVYNVRSDPAWRASWGVTRSTVAYGYPVAANDPVAASVIADLRRSDAPRCMIPDYPEQVSAHGTTAWVQQTARSCPGMDAWATAHWSHWWGTWLLTHPGPTLRIIGTELPNSLSTPVWTDVMAAVPAPVGSAFFGTAGLPQSAVPGRTYRTQPVLLWVTAVLVLGWFGRRRLRQSPWAVDAMLAASVVGALASAVSSGLLIQTAAFEVGRESAGATVLMAASLVVLVGCGLDRLGRGAAVRGAAVRGADVGES